MEMEKETFLNNFGREYQITKRLIKAFPAGKLGFRPHPKLRTARELASIFPAAAGMIPDIVTKLKVEQSSGRKIKNTSVDSILSEYEKIQNEAVESVKKTPAKRLEGRIDFFGTSMRVIDVLWLFMMDSIHHRGQLSVYLRLVGGKVPPIYGPTADYPKGEAGL